MAAPPSAPSRATTARTADVIVSDASGAVVTTDFGALLLSAPVLEGLRRSGIVRPSPIQLRAIPIARSGLDLQAQAKSGTGKTCVFVVAVLESLLAAQPPAARRPGKPHALVLVPTRELAVQVREVFVAVGRCVRDLRVAALIGGRPVSHDAAVLRRGCHVAVGTPGRVRALMEQRLLVTRALRVIVLDEVDRLLCGGPEDGDDGLATQTRWICCALPPRRQTLAFSATFPTQLCDVLAQLMRDPVHVMLAQAAPSLRGVRQYYYAVPSALADDAGGGPAKTELVLRILSRLPFAQCMIFSNDRSGAESLANVLTANRWPAAFVSGDCEQQHRLATLALLRQFRLRVLISTDLTARGIDIASVDLVVNLDMPHDAATYLHRIGRTGRFGSLGTAVSIVTASELRVLHRYCAAYATSVEPLHLDNDDDGDACRSVPLPRAAAAPDTELLRRADDAAAAPMAHAPAAAAAPREADAEPRLGAGLDALLAWWRGIVEHDGHLAQRLRTSGERARCFHKRHFTHAPWRVRGRSGGVAATHAAGPPASAAATASAVAASMTSGARGEGTAAASVGCV